MLIGASATRLFAHDCTAAEWVMSNMVMVTLSKQTNASSALGVGWWQRVNKHAIKHVRDPIQLMVIAYVSE